LGCDDIVESLTDKLVQILSSDESVIMEECVFYVWKIVIHSGSGNTKRPIHNLKEDKRLKRCIVQTKTLPSEKICGARAIITGLTHHTNTIFDREISELEKLYI